MGQSNLQRSEMGRGKHILQKRAGIRGTADFDYSGVRPHMPIGSFKKKGYHIMRKLWE